MRAVAARWWATAHRARSEEQELELERVGMPGPSNRQVKQEKPRRWPTLGSTLSSVSRRTPTPSASNWPRYLPRKLVGGGEAASPSDRRKQWPVHATLRAPRARGASRCMRGAENLVLQEGQAARRDLTRALKAGPPGEGAERSHRLFVLPGGQPGPPSVPGAPDTRCLLRRFPVQV